LVALSFKGFSFGQMQLVKLKRVRAARAKAQSPKATLTAKL